MVTQSLKTIAKTEKDLEQYTGVSNNTQDPAEQTQKEMRKITEAAAFSAISAAEQWGKKSFDNDKEIKEEDVCL